jgi:hypothetical protein
MRKPLKNGITIATNGRRDSSSLPSARREFLDGVASIIADEVIKELATRATDKHIHSKQKTRAFEKIIKKGGANNG